MTELPEKIYVERWPEELDREDSIHYEQTGYGVDMRTGATSEITVYVKEAAPKSLRARIAELTWVLDELEGDDSIAAARKNINTRLAKFRKSLAAIENRAEAKEPTT